MFLALLALLILGQSAPSQPGGPVKLYLGAVPSKEGFVPAANKDFEDSYRDARAEYRKDTNFRRDVELVSNIDQADIVLEIVDRGLRDTGTRASSGTVIGGTTVLGSSTPVRQKRILARLVVIGTGYVLELDGQAGIKLVNYRQQARNLLRQVIEWVKANRPVLAKVQ